MANRILTTDGWEQRIRDKIGVDIAYLPDSAVQQPECVSVAEANIITQIPDYSSLTGDDKVYLEAAVVCECANLLCPSMPTRLPIKEQGPSETHELNIDWNKNKKSFIEERDNFISKISTVITPTLFHFGISSPIRDWEE